MKKILFLFILISAFSFAQKIRIDKIDKFSNKRTIETSFVEFTKSSTGFLVPNNVLGASIILEQEKLYLKMLWYTVDQPKSITQGDKILFLDSNGEKYEFIVTSDNQSEQVKQAMTEIYYYRNYFYLVGDLESLEGKKFTDIRYSQNGIYKDFSIPAKYQDNLSKLATVYFDYIKKQTGK